jgi:hypothetical protein
MADARDAKKGWWKHAFAVDEPGEVEPTEAQRPAVEWVCRQVARRRLAAPGLVFLEMSRPLNWVAAQGMHAFAPFVWAIAQNQTHDRYCAFVQFLEQRGSVDYLCRRIEELEEELAREHQAKKQSRKQGKKGTPPAAPDA